MKGARGWILALLLSLAVAAGAYLGQPNKDSPEHNSNSDAVNGTSAARLFAQAMGHPTGQVAGSFSPPASGGLLFVFTPTSPYTADEADRTVSWVRSGGVLIFAAEQGDPELDRALVVRHRSAPASSSIATATPVLDSVTKVAGHVTATPFAISAGQVAILRSPDGLALAYLERMGSGTVVVLADPLVLCNGYLDKRDNGRLVSDLLGLVGRGAPVAFDEYHHGLILSDLSPRAWVTTPWGAAILWLLVAMFAGLLMRGRAFGPVVARPVEVPRADVEWAVAVGQLLRRSGARSVTLGLLASAAERAVAARTGLPVQPRDRFWNALWVRAPGLAGELAQAESALHGSAGGDADLLKAAQRLHGVAYPPPEDRRRRRPQ